MQDLSISLIQCPLIWEDVNANLDYFNRSLGSLKEHSDIILLPEMFSTGFSMAPERLAETMGGQVWEWMSDWAFRLNSVMAGSQIVLEHGRYYNRFLWVEPDGQTYKYDKRHLFRMGDEPKHYSAGKTKTIVSYKGWKILPLVCYDLRFPVWSKNRVSPLGFDYDVILYVANWPTRRIKHWDILLKARAIENQAFVAAVNRTGYDGNGINHDGHSVILDPLGEILADAGSESEVVLRAQLGYRMLQEYRERFPVSTEWDDYEIKF
jgi:predicted amidohydrolase